jgi:triosephosphate isomerase
MLIIANWKMHKTMAETKEHLARLKPLVFRASADVWVAVPYTDIYPAVQEVSGSKIQIGAQNMSELLAGALTGEVSPVMIEEAGASFVLIGHSERRKLFHEDNRTINRKIKLALKLGLKPVLCIGESQAEKEAGQTEEVLKKKLSEGLEGLQNEEASRLILAYEPVWAIGTKQPCPPESVEKIHQFCQNYVAEELGLGKVPVVYGGSVSSENCEAFLRLSHVGGLLVGGASLDVNAFAEIVWKAQG